LKIMCLPKAIIQLEISYKGLDTYLGEGECLSKAVEVEEKVTNVANM